MKAATARTYGPPEVVRLETLPDPVPGPGQVLVRVAAFGVTRGDARIRGLEVPAGMGPLVRAVFGFTRPRRVVPGRDYAGAVAALGPGVTGWDVGDPVFGITDGMTMGAGAERVAVKARGLIFRRPDSLTAEEAAGFLFGGLTAADFLIDQMAVRAGERVLVIGASGAVGGAAVQIAAHLGARVTARRFGAQEVADYAQGLPPGPFDAILDTPGALPWPAARALLATGGRLGMVTAGLGAQLGATLRPRRGGLRLCAGMVRESRAAVGRLLAILAAGGYRPDLGAVLPMSEVVQAHRLAGSGHKRGNVVVRT